MLKRLEQLWQTEGRAHQGDFISPFCQSPVDRGGGGSEREERRRGERSGASQTRAEMLEVACCQPTNWLARPIFGALAQARGAVGQCWAVMCRCRTHRCVSTDLSPAASGNPTGSFGRCVGYVGWRECLNNTTHTKNKNHSLARSLARSLAHLPKLSYVSYRYS